MSKKVFYLIPIMLLIVFTIIIIKILPENKSEDTNIINEEVEKIEELKEEYQMTGNNELYEVQTEYDGRQVPVIKSGINYKVAFAGLIKNSKPEFNELDKIFEQNYPTKTGIWIAENSRQKILKYLNDNLEFEYEINKEGYLKIKRENGYNQQDIKIKTIINSEKQYILNISSVYYMIDVVTGKIIDNPYEELDRYQTYDYIEDTGKTIIFITQNSRKLLTQTEIFENILDLIQE